MLVFGTSRLHYYNALYFYLILSCSFTVSLNCCNLITEWDKTEKTVCVTPVLAAVHWLPMHYSIQYKVKLFVFKPQMALHLHIDTLHPHTPSRSLRSASQSLLIVPERVSCFCCHSGMISQLTKE